MYSLILPFTITTMMAFDGSFCHRHSELFGWRKSSGKVTTGLDLQADCVFDFILLTLSSNKG